MGKGCARSIPLTRWPALPKAAAATLQHGGFARGMAGGRVALLQGAVQLLNLVGSARNTAPMGSALSAVAALPPYRQRKERAASTAVADRKCARRKAAPRLHYHAASAGNMALSERARLMAAPPTQSVVALHTAASTAAGSEKQLRFVLLQLPCLNSTVIDYVEGRSPGRRRYACCTRMAKLVICSSNNGPRMY